MPDRREIVKPTARVMREALQLRKERKAKRAIRQVKAAFRAKRKAPEIRRKTRRRVGTFHTVTLSDHPTS